VDIVRVLLDAGLDPNRVSRGEGWNALATAVRRRKESLTKVLRERGGRLAWTEEMVLRSLESGNEDLVRRLVRAGGLPPSRLMAVEVGFMESPSTRAWLVLEHAASGEMDETAIMKAVVAGMSRDEHSVGSDCLRRGWAFLGTLVALADEHPRGALALQNLRRLEWDFDVLARKFHRWLSRGDLERLLRVVGRDWSSSGGAALLRVDMWTAFVTLWDLGVRPQSDECLWKVLEKYGDGALAEALFGLLDEWGQARWGNRQMRPTWRADPTWSGLVAALRARGVQ
jgi:hypothetical protein